MAVDAKTPSDSSASPSIGDDETDRSMTYFDRAAMFAMVFLQGLGAFVEDLFGLDPARKRDMAIIRAVQVIGSAVILIGIIVVVVNEVFTTDAVNNTSGPFSPVVNDVETTGVSAMALLVVGLVVVAARSLMGGGGMGGMFGGGGGGGF